LLIYANFLLKITLFLFIIFLGYAIYFRLMPYATMISFVSISEKRFKTYFKFLLSIFTLYFWFLLLIMQKTLCFDFGNTRCKCGVMEDKYLKEEIILTGLPDEIEQLLAQQKPDKTILASVVNHDETIEKILSEKSSFHKVTSNSKLNIYTPAGHPETVGADRWAMLSGAIAAFPKQHNLVIGLGTCMTFNFINKFNEFLGGAISPGLYMRLKSLNDFTALLPLVEPKWNFPLIGYDTDTNILSGIILGMSKEIDGIIDEYKLKFNNLNVLITGGDLPFFHSHIQNQVIAAPYLIYEGLYYISRNN